MIQIVSAPCIRREAENEKNNYYDNFIGPIDSPIGGSNETCHSSMFSGIQNDMRNDKTRAI